MNRPTQHVNTDCLPSGRLRGLENELIALKESVDRKSREFALLLDKAIE
ncbi:MAG TPA: hypothetical protein VGR73_01455 [Bryobacteraceae bacterium]|nr:hypothetical protein [Bryobacteraceae bacterium]